MDPVSIAIIAALCAGATDGKPQVIARMYDTLKLILDNKYGADSEFRQAIESLEKKPNSTGRRQVLIEEVVATRADQDIEIMGIVEALIDKIREETGGELPMHARGMDEAAPVDGRSPAVKVAWPDYSGQMPLQRPPRVEYFTGRRAELAQLLIALQPGRVISLCGSSGVGKSALVAEAIWTLAPGAGPPHQFPDGIIHYNFYNRPRLDLVFEHIVRACGEELWPTPEEAVKRALDGRRMLLVLEGVEQLEAWPEVLTTQRSSCLLITGHRCPKITPQPVELKPLPLSEAVSLLQAWGSAASLDWSTARQICEVVGCMPLALRLIGSYLSVSPEETPAYLAWLQDTPLATLDEVRRGPESIPLLLAYSLSQVSETAKQAMAIAGTLALAPFRPEVVAEALELGVHHGIWATILRVFKPEPEDEDAPEIEIPQERVVLDELVRYGLLRPIGHRYEISQALLHAYARQHLTPSNKVMARLVAYCTTLIGEQILLGIDGYATLDTERPHLMQLMATCVDQGNWQAAYGLATAIEDYLDLRGYRIERVIANETGLTAARKLERRHNEGAWLGNLGLAYSEMGQADKAIEYYQQALDIAREVGDRRSEGNSLGKLGLAYRDLGLFDKTRTYLEQALAIFEEINSPSADMVRDWLSEFKPGQG